MQKNHTKKSHGIIIKKEVGFCLFNETGKLLNLSTNELPMYRLANALGLRLVNLHSKIGMEIVSRIGMKIATNA
jgi:hypothetical protein